MEASPRKREAPSGAADAPPIFKKPRLHQDAGATDTDGGEDILDDADHSPSRDSMGSPAPSLPFTEDSVADTAMTSVSKPRRPKKYLCDFEGCDKAFDRPVRLETHKRSHTNERPFICQEDDCQKTFLRNEHLTRHIKDKHSDERNYICTYAVTDDNGQENPCGKTFNTGTRLRRHVAAHEEKEQTKCNVIGCGKVFRKQETLQRHIKKDHLHEKAYICTHTIMDDSGEPEDCGEAFATVGQLKGHVLRNHSSPRFFCEICPPLEPHDMPHADGMSDGGSVFPFVQGYFRPVFATHADLQMHIKAAHPPKCPECGQQCESNRALKAHQDIEHSSLPERQQHKCTWPGCERGFTKAGNLKVHIQNVHAKIKNFACGLFDLKDSPKTAGWDGQGCGLAFGTKSNLEEHVRTQHLGMASKQRPSRLKKIKAEESMTPSSLMDIDEAPTPADPDDDNGNALAMLTGIGYESSKPIGCLVSGCQLRFSRDYDLAQHLELTHDWDIEDVNEAIAERDALAGDDFWIGGTNEGDAEDDLRQQIYTSLNIGQPYSGMTNSLRSGEFMPEMNQKQWEEFQRTQHLPEVGQNDDPMLDPALARI